jgi:hypothetical protein
MSGFKIALPGERFGRLIVLSACIKNGRISYRDCLCDCGNKVSVQVSRLVRGTTTSCGCYHREKSAIVCTERNTTHGLSKEDKQLYRAWKGMRSRCYCITNPSYPRWGGRGITCCSEWNDYSLFREWSLKNGYEPNKKLTIDRIDNDGNYTPDNCRWTSRREQSRNRSSNVWLTIDGKTLLQEDWSRLTGVSSALINQRLKNGVSCKDAVMIANLRKRGC